MYYRKFVFLLLTLCVFGQGFVQSRTVTLDGTSCGKCQLESMISSLAGGALSSLDDVVIKGIPNAVYTISKPVLCRTMSITSGTVNLVSTLDLKGTLSIASGATMIVTGAIKGLTNVLNVDGILNIKGGASAVAQLNCNANAKINIEAGSLTVNGLLAAATSSQIISGTGQLINNGKCIFNSIPSVLGTAQFVVNGATQLSKGITCSDKSLLSINTKATVDILANSIFSSPIVVAANAQIKLTNGNHVFNGINGATNSLMTIVNGAVNLNGAAPSTCHTVDLTGAGSINVNAPSTINTIKAIATANVNVAAAGILNIASVADIKSMLNIKDTANVIVNAKATANLLGGVTSVAQSQIKALDNSVLNMGKTCTTSQPIILGKQTVMNAIEGTHQWTQGLTSQVNSIINVASNSKVTANKDCSFGILNLASGSNVNINSGTTVVAGALTTAEKSALAVTNAIINLKADSVIKSALDINAKAKAIFDAKVDLINGINTHADATLDINHNVNVLGSSTIKALTNLNANGMLVFGGSKDVTHTCSGDVKSDSKSTLNVVSGAILHLDGDAILAGTHKLVDGSQIIVNGNANIITGLTSAGNALSHFTVGPTGSCVLGSVPMPTVPSFPTIPGFSFPMTSSGKFHNKGNKGPSSNNNNGNHGPSSNNNGNNNGPSFPGFPGFPSSNNNGQSTTTSSSQSTGSQSIINGNIIVNAGGSLDVLGKCNVGQTVKNMGSMLVSQPIVIAGDAFTQVDANAVLNMVAGGSIESKAIDFTKGTIQGVGALKCGTCSFANNIAANLNIVGNVKMASTATVFANIDALVEVVSSTQSSATQSTTKTVNGKTTTTSSSTSSSSFSKQFVPMIACSGTAEIAGNLNVVASAANQAKIDAGSVFKFISAPVVKGNLSSVNCLTSAVNGVAQKAAAAAVAKAWSLVQSPCNCDCSLKRL